jgi:hypothetical protein
MTRVLKNAGRCPAVGSAADSPCAVRSFLNCRFIGGFFLSRFVMSVGLVLTRAFAAVSRL